MEAKLNLQFHREYTPQEQEQIRKDVRVLILRECGAKDDHVGPELSTLQSIAEAVRKTGMSEDELERRSVEDMIQRGKNPFEDMPEHLLRYAEKRFPDLVELARRKFRTGR